jgi:hypothetical protein
MPDELLLQTDRGDLSRDRHGGRLYVRRHIPSRLAGRRFKESIETLDSAIRRIQPPRVLPLVRCWGDGDYYHMEYGTAWPVEVLPLCFSRMHWLERLRFLRPILGGCADIYGALRPPLGLHAGSILACRTAGGWEAHLALCPPLDLAAPDELLHTAPWVLAGIAPERLRGVSGEPAKEDVFAAGSLVLLALGTLPGAGMEGDEAIEAQARAAFLSFAPERLPVEPALRRIPPIESRIRALCDAAACCVHFDPQARPYFDTLKTACDAVLEVATADFADAVLSQANAGDALRYLEWGMGCGRDGFHVRRRAAALCEQLGMARRELDHLNHMLKLSPGDATAARRRWKLRYEMYVDRPNPTDEDARSEGAWLLAELEKLPPTDVDKDDERAVAQAKEDRLCAAQIHGRLGDLYARAKDLYELTRLDFQDIEALLLYGLSCREIARQSQSRDEQATMRGTLEQLFQSVRDRVTRLAASDFMDEADATKWIERCQTLLLS